MPVAGKNLLIHEEETRGIDGRLPKHFMDFHRQWKIGPQEFIHIQKNENLFEKDEFGLVVPVQNANIPVLYPDEFHDGLWGGEGVIKGRLRPKPLKHDVMAMTWPKPKYWWPKLHFAVVFSEVLDKHFELVATERGEFLVDQSGGLDYYLLTTPVNEIYAKKLLLIKREILLHLALPEERIAADKRDEVMKKFGKFAIPKEEADWHGLPIELAREKQEATERLEQEDIESTPAKAEFRAELIQALREGAYDDLDPEILFGETKGETVSSLAGKVSDFFSSKKK